MDIQAVQQLIDHVMGPLVEFAKTAGPAAITKISEGASNKVGEELVEQGKKLFSAIQNRFAREKDENHNDTALLALSGFQRDPDTFRTALERKLLEILLTDKIFFTELSQQVQQGPAQQVDAVQSTFIRSGISNKHDRGTQIIRTHKSKFVDSPMEITTACQSLDPSERRKPRKKWWVDLFGNHRKIH